MSSDLHALKQVANAFGVGDSLIEQIENKVDKFAKDGEDWADATASDWYDAAPWATGTLRESIETDTSNITKPKVLVNHQKLMAHAGQKLTAIRKVYRGQKVKMPDYDYLKEAEEQNVSASTSVEPLEPNSEREMKWNPDPNTPFLYSIWDELAKKNKRIIFNGR